jgi:hypothetical protein
MKIIVLISSLLFIMFASCRNDSISDLVNCSDGCQLLSNIQDKKNYVMPFTLFHDLGSSVKELELNGEELDLEGGEQLVFDKTGYFELKIHFTQHNRPSETKRFALATEERKDSEWGLETWIPSKFSTQHLYAETVQVVYAKSYVSGIGIPFVFNIMKDDQRSPVYAEALYIQRTIPFYIKRGIGSVVVKSNEISGDPAFNIGGISVETNIRELIQPAMELSGELNTHTLIPENASVRITGDLHVGSGASLTVNAGSVILIDEAVNIENEGPITFNGTLNNPILVTCSDGDKYWGGFISNGNPAEIQAEYSFFCRSGYHDTGDYETWGHAQRQALFYCNNSSLRLKNCFMLDHIGQVFYPTDATLELESILIQRVKTSGQLNYTNATIRNSIFSDFPDDSYEFRDEDNDALYINGSNVTIDRCTFMFAKDDGMDSGGNAGGTVSVTNSRFESCFHEGSSLSSGGEVVKNHTFFNCIFYNCGQGLELGFSSPNHSVHADSCQFLDNYIGIRFGDNYDWSTTNGQMYISNSVSLHNGKDIWNMERQTWEPKLDHMHFENVQVSALVPQYPELEVIIK